MILSHLRLHQFKNHEESIFDFCDKINTISGPNGSGKTNILDAIYTLANTKSYFNHLDQQLIQFGKEEYSIKGLFQQNNASEELDLDILLTLQNKKKSLKKNGKLYSRLLDHIGTIQTVFITPFDISLVFEGSEERRKFIDYSISQVNKSYLLTLVDYRKYIDQRNAFLKMNFGRPIDPLILESFDVKISPLADRIHLSRKTFIEEFIPFFTENHRFISESFVIALKIAQYQYFKSHCNQNPILLLDDIFEKIDSNRSQKLMERMCSSEFGQIFVSDTHTDRIKEHFKPFQVDQKHFTLVK